MEDEDAAITDQELPSRLGPAIPPDITYDEKKLQVNRQ